MAKLTREQKIEIYHKRKEGITFTSLSKQYNINKQSIQYLIRLLDKHGECVLRKEKNRYYHPALKLEIINQVLIHKQSVTSTALEYGLLSAGLLFNWIKFYIEKDYTIVERKRGRHTTMTKRNKLIDSTDKDAIIQAKEEEIVRLKAENEYLKKLRAVVQARKNQQPKRK